MRFALFMKENSFQLISALRHNSNDFPFIFLVHSFYEEITPQEWNMLEKEASKVKGEPTKTARLSLHV